jgi:dTDP-4-amino-4,6-dideoxygalactose transaminase
MASPLLQLGGIPVFCDIDKKTLTIDINDMKKKLTPKTKAIMVFQPWGNVANIDEIVSFAKKHSLVLISDSSHAPNAKWQNRPLGEYFDIICASFGKGKLISGGELGVFTTNNKEFRDRALLYSHTNRVPKAYLTDTYKDISNIVGIKYRPHPFAITLALDQMNTFNERNNILLKNISKLLSVISEIKGLSFQNKYNRALRNCWKIILVGKTETIEKLHELAIKHNLKIESNHYKTLLHEDSIFTKYYKINQTNFPVAEQLKDKIIQIEAIQLFDKEVLDNYMDLFSELKGDLND